MDKVELNTRDANDKKKINAFIRQHKFPIGNALNRCNIRVTDEMGRQKSECMKGLGSLEE